MRPRKRSKSPPPKDVDSRALGDAVAEDRHEALALVRDHADSKTVIPPFQPLSAAHYALHKRVKAAFDPLSVLNFGRMHNGI